MIRLLLFLGLLLSLLSLSLVWLFRTPLTEKVLSSALNTTVKLKKVELSKGQIHLCDLEILEGAATLLSSSRVSLEINLLSLLQEVVKIEELKLDGARLAKNSTLLRESNRASERGHRFVVHHFKVVNLRTHAMDKTVPFFEAYGIGQRKPLSGPELACELTKRLDVALTKSGSTKKLSYAMPKEKGPPLIDTLKNQAVTSYNWTTSQFQKASTFFKDLFSSAQDFCKN